MARCPIDVPVQSVQSAIDGMKVDHLLEEFEEVVTNLVVRKECD